ncbi:MAG: sigma-70 family RNA polymerase sigma factor [Chloroflexi bacterium]|nr:sigma-70 family RNA polymerase sigma factor [Chloroflexota bacterium]
MVEYQELEDHQLIHWIALAEKEALEALYGRYSSSVFSLAMYMLKQEALAEEVTQDIFLNIWLKASSYKSDRGAPRAWIMSVAHHKIVDVIRSRRRTLTVTDPSLYETLDLIPSSEVPVDEQVVRNLERERILKALSTLPQPQRQVIMLAYFGGYSQSEMAEMLQQPLGTVKTRVRLAMQKLRGVLERDVHD